ncbi:hypothetical protein LSH36_69g07017 [Paralvinella palmiformis]|uniref:Glycosyltransferase n=1 Tax=Paralvinella palmiformis TaxID=53620 RepID=A0AAD9K4Q6_9ANNE|nr:hypothetical protein LSH36_69g07017 [Paralvinella palmiformis]
MLNRIENLERLLASWKGPSQVALYLTDEEVVTFKEIYNNSNILQQADATYHVIYKRQVFYPINYMRNVAIRETNTPFHIMIDVDFVIQPTLFDSISSYVKNLQFDEKKVQSGFCYEPYVVVPTSKFLYDEIFLERMRDKVTYTAKIVLSGCRVTLYERVMRELENNPTALDQSWNII